jgi:hypothetical protein
VKQLALGAIHEFFAHMSPDGKWLAAYIPVLLRSPPSACSRLTKSSDVVQCRETKFAEPQKSNPTNTVFFRRLAQSKNNSEIPVRKFRENI